MSIKKSALFSVLILKSYFLSYLTIIELLATPFWVVVSTRNSPVTTRSNMLYFTICTLAAPLLLPYLVRAVPVSLMVRDTDEAYALSNCVNNVTRAAYASVLYYSDFSIVSEVPPDSIGSINSYKAISWEGHTWTITTPFKFSATIFANATTAAYDTYVGSALTSTYAGPSQALKWDGELIYTPATNVNCFADYLVVDEYEP